MSPALPAGPQPLAGIKVIELTHMVMGPATGAILAELGAQVVRIEPIDGDSTRYLQGSGAGYFPGKLSAYGRLSCTPSIAAQNVYSDCLR